MGLFSYIVVTVVGGAVMTVCPPLAPAVASAVGIGSVGIGAGTLAASAHAYVGNLAAGSVIAGLQSIAMVAPIP